jgi:hypothetical protein
MTDKNIAIHVRGLGRKYTLGGPQEKYQTFRDAIINFCEGAVQTISPRSSCRRILGVKGHLV